MYQKDRGYAGITGCKIGIYAKKTQQQKVLRHINDIPDNGPNQYAAQLLSVKMLQNLYFFPKELQTPGQNDAPGQRHEDTEIKVKEI